MPTDIECKKRIAFLKPADKLFVTVIRNSYSLRLPWNIEIQCDRQVWPSDFVRGGFTRRWLVSSSRSLNTAESTAGRLLRKLKRLHTEKTNED